MTRGAATALTQSRTGEGSLRLVDTPRGDGDPLAGFAFYLRREREVSGATTRAYTYWADRFAGWALDNGVSLLHVTPLDIRRFSTSADWSRKTRSQVLSSLKAFYRYCVLDGFIEHSPAECLNGPRLFARRGPSYRTDEARALLVSPLDFADQVIVGLGLFAGVRTGEGLGLEVRDISFVDGIIHIRRTLGEPTTKGKRERAQPMHGWMREPLRTAVRLATEERLFDFGADGYRARLRRMCKRAGVPYHGPHALRRTFSNTLVHNGVREGIVRHLMGHAPTVTDLYVEVTPAECRAAIRGLRY